MLVQADVHTLANVPSQPAARGRRDVPARGDYENVAKRTRSASFRNSTRSAKKPHCFLTTELAKELSFPQRSSEAAGAAVEISMPIMVTPETVSEAAPAIPEPYVVIVAGLGTGVIPLPPIMMPGMITPSRSPTTGLVFFRKFKL